MDAITNFTLTNLTAYGAPVLLFVAYIGSLGIPFPITLVIIAAGAFTRSGVLDWRLAMAACLAGAMLADHSEYFLGRWAQNWIRKCFDQKPVWQEALKIIDSQGAWAIFLTRFWLTPLAPEVNVIAGSRYPYLAFLFFDLSGEFLWVLLYGGLGYIFAAQWELVSKMASGFSVASMVLVVLGLVGYFILRKRRQKASQS